jgi:hypothetical protein
MASPSNPIVIPIVTYEYLICLMSSERLWPPARRKAQGLLSESCTLGTVHRQLLPKRIRIRPSSVQWQMADEQSSP